MNLLLRKFTKLKTFKSHDLKVLMRSLSSFTRTDVKIPVPITGGHLAAQLWETKSSTTSSLPPIVCMHGYQDNSCSFDPLIPLIIKDGMTILCVDQPGHGLSSHLSGPGLDFVFDGIVAIHRVLRHFGWDKIILLSHSYGSILSFVFTATNPDKVEKYIGIENIHAIPRDFKFQIERTTRNLFKIEAKLTDPNQIQPSYTFDEILERTYKARKGTVTEEGCRTLLKRGARPDPKNPNMYQFTHDLKTNIPSTFGRFFYDESLQMAASIKCPVCVIKGDPGEDYEPRENFMKIVEAIRAGNGGKLSFHLVPGTHHLHLNEPQSVAPLISKFLETNFSENLTLKF